MRTDDALHGGGEHTPIIDQPLWDAVRAQLNANTTERSSGTRTRQSSLLAGMLFDPDGNRMTPTHAIKEGRRYRYYVSRPLITNEQTDGSAGLRFPAGEIEQAVSSRLLRYKLGWTGDVKRTCRRAETLELPWILRNTVPLEATR